MKKINYLGFLSLLALIAILGWCTENTGLYGFLGFAYYIRYFWVIPDEFFRLNVQKAATFAFMSEMISLVPFMFVCTFIYGVGIKEYRVRFDMKQEELASKVGVRRETIGNLEKGKYNPSLVLAWNIAKVFGVSIEEIFTVED